MVDAATWEVKRKVFLPDEEMNNPHNMWTDRAQNLIYVTEWLGSKLTIFDRLTGALIDRPGPHTHWMSHDGETMVTPNVFTGDSTIYDFVQDEIQDIVSTGGIESHPIATGMMPDSSKYYVAKFS